MNKGRSRTYLMPHDFMSNICISTVYCIHVSTTSVVLATHAYWEFLLVRTARSVRLHDYSPKYMSNSNVLLSLFILVKGLYSHKFLPPLLCSLPHGYWQILLVFPNLWDCRPFSFIIYLFPFIWGL